MIKPKQPRHSTQVFIAVFRILHAVVYDIQQHKAALRICYDMRVMLHVNAFKDKGDLLLPDILL